MKLYYCLAIVLHHYVYIYNKIEDINKPMIHNILFPYTMEVGFSSIEISRSHVVSG